MTLTKQTLGPLQREWVEKLRTGGFEQTTECLHDREGYCCLGVALEHVLGVKPVGETEGEFVYEYNGETVPSDALPPAAANAIGLRDALGGFAERDLPEAVAEEIWNRLEHGHSTECSLAELNDRGFTFEEIADFIEAYPSAVFKEAR